MNPAHLTTERLAVYRGGHIEVVGEGDQPYRFKGEIAKISVTPEGELQVGCTLLAQDQGFPSAPGSWVADPDPVIEVYLDPHYTVVTELATEGVERILLKSERLGESMTLYPPGDNPLDRSFVAGLAPATA